MFSVSYAVYLFVIATVLAWVEIQIEGKYGWAEKLPCWRPASNNKIAKLYTKFMGGKPLTGYHLVMFSFMPVVLHLPFFAGTDWNWIKELETLSAIVLLWNCEDFLWFVWNPHYGLKKFKPDFIWWHKKWIKNIVPIDYPVNLIQSAVLVSIAVPLSGSDVMVRWSITIGIITGLTLISIFISHLWRKGRA